jgi:hypothetical protein
LSFGGSDCFKELLNVFNANIVAELPAPMDHAPLIQHFRSGDSISAATLQIVLEDVTDDNERMHHIVCHRVSPGIERGGISKGSD